MRIVVDEASVELELPRQGVQLGQVVQEVEDYLLSVGRVPVSLSVDGKALTQEELERRLSEEVKGQERFQFGSMTFVAFVAESLRGVSGANQELLKILKSFADEIHNADAVVSCDAVVTELNHFFDFWARLHGMLPKVFEKVKFDGRNLSGLFEQLQKVLAETVQAMEQKDFILAADLLRYEVVPSIEALDKGIPALLQELDKAAQTCSQG